MFAPLFGYSSSAMGSNDDGETNMFKMLALNPEQKIDAFYIVGADHCHRINPKTGGADTIQKIEGHLARNTGNFNDALHSVSIIFIERGARQHAVETCLPIAFIPEMPFAASSTIIREVFQGKRGINNLALMPHAAYRYSLELGLYASDHKFPLQKKHQQPAHAYSSYREAVLVDCITV